MYEIERFIPESETQNGNTPRLIRAALNEVLTEKGVPVGHVLSLEFEKGIEKLQIEQPITGTSTGDVTEGTLRAHTQIDQRAANLRVIQTDHVPFPVGQHTAYVVLGLNGSSQEARVYHSDRHEATIRATTECVTKLLHGGNS